jgi:hypothetical protein
MQRMSRLPAALAIALVVVGLAGLGLALRSAQAAKAEPAAAKGNDMLLQARPAVNLDETPRAADGRPLALETATFALG